MGQAFFKKNCFFTLPWLGLGGTIRWALFGNRGPTNYEVSEEKTVRAKVFGCVCVCACGDHIAK